MVMQDGAKYVREKGEYRLHHVFDNLIHRGEMPVTIAVCVNPGVVPGGEGAQDRFNRSFEYDTVSDRYASFLIDELIPEVRKSYAITRRSQPASHRWQQQRRDRRVWRGLAP